MFEKIRNKLRYRLRQFNKFLKKFRVFFCYTLLIIICLSSILSLTLFYLANKLTFQEFINDIILLVSAIIILGYVVETYKIRQEAVKQNNIATCPLLVVHLKDKNLVVKNIGHGIAFEPKIENQRISEDEDYNYWYEYKIKKPFILPLEESEVSIEFVKFQKSEENDVEIKKTFKPLIGISNKLYDLSQHKYFHKSNFSLKINYKDIGRGFHYSENIIKLRESESASLYDFK